MELSKRLQAVADLVSNGVTVADVGTDHGYIPIYLVESGKNKCAIAMDINRGPLDRAEAHIRMHGLGEQIKTRLSDGVQKLQIGECDCVIVAGMGGGLVIKIMEDGEEIFRNLTEFILQPQSEIAKVRQYLCEHNYRIIAEDMVLEDGKFYPMMKVANGSAEELQYIRTAVWEVVTQRKNHPVLKLFLEKEEKTKEQICRQLRKEEGIHIASRIAELENETAQTKEALGIY